MRSPAYYARTATPDNNEMQRTKHGRDGASPLISVFGVLRSGRCVREKGEVTPFVRSVPSLRWLFAPSSLTLGLLAGETRSVLCKGAVGERFES
jgi:hypothetical protein